MNRRKDISVVLAVCVLIMALSGAAGADTYYVDPNGFKDFPTIQAAIDDPCTVDGDEIEVAPATYNEAINFNGKAVRLYSIGGADVTIIDANNIGGAYHAVQCVSGEDANTILEGFTITGGNANGMEPNDQHGGGMFNDSSSPTITNCTFSGNSASNCGGGMYCLNSSPTVTNCIFFYNWADFSGGGGGMYNDSNSSPTVTNCIFFDNWAYSDGGGIFNDNSSPKVTNCTFSGNFATNGGGMYNYDNSSPTVANCIFWLNIPDSIYDETTSSTTVTYSDVEYGWTGAGGNNIKADPLFEDEFGRNLRVVVGSPCVDAGDNAAVPASVTTDLDGNPRVVDGDRDGNDIVDMGAYESPPAPIHNITQKTYYSTIQAAIDGANGGDEIEVFQGTYNEAINFIGKAITLRSSDPNDPNIVAATVIDGTGNYHVVQCVSSEGPNTVLSGFTITGGNANGDYPDERGGGMYNSGSSPTVTNCTFSGNSADYLGGGMHNYDSSSQTVTNCTFSGNSANYGGGMENYYYSSPTVTNCNFTGNHAEQNGGGMENYDSSSPTVTNCTFNGNSANNDGGGMYNCGGIPTVTNCTFSGNSADNNGGGMYNLEGNLIATNCTFSGNIADANGGGVYNDDSSPMFTNCILWGDTAVIDGNEIALSERSTADVNYCDVKGGEADIYKDGSSTLTWGINIDADPYFVNADASNFRLLHDSPCIDAGDSTGLWQKRILEDMDGKIRYVDISGVTDTGSGPVTFVDMGAYEFQCSGIGGDNNCDGVVNLKDLAILCNNWLAGL